MDGRQAEALANVKEYLRERCECGGEIAARDTIDVIFLSAPEDGEMAFLSVSDLEELVRYVEWNETAVAGLTDRPTG